VHTVQVFVSDDQAILLRSSGNGDVTFTRSNDARWLHTQRWLALEWGVVREVVEPRSVGDRVVVCEGGWELTRRARSDVRWVGPTATDALTPIVAPLHSRPSDQAGAERVREKRLSDYASGRPSECNLCTERVNDAHVCDQ
jgi:hypothetical protein